MNININIFCNLYALSFINCKLYSPERCIICKTQNKYMKFNIPSVAVR